MLQSLNVPPAWQSLAYGKSALSNYLPIINVKMQINRALINYCNMFSNKEMFFLIILLEMPFIANLKTASSVSWKKLMAFLLLDAPTLSYNGKRKKCERRAGHTQMLSNSRKRDRDEREVEGGLCQTGMTRAAPEIEE